MKYFLFFFSFFLFFNILEILFSNLRGYEKVCLNRRVQILEMGGWLDIINFLGKSLNKIDPIACFE